MNILVIIGAAWASTIDVLEPQVSKIDLYSSFIISDEYETDFKLENTIRGPNLGPKYRQENIL